MASANDYSLIVEGVARMLERFEDDLEVCDRIVVGEPIDTPIDVVLYDTYGRIGIAAEALDALARTPEIHHVAIFSLRFTDELIADGVTAGARGFISKALNAEAIRDAILAIESGEIVYATESSGDPLPDELDWPGRSEGVSERESQVLILVAEGLTNPEIAKALYLNVETVKTHVRQVLAKLDLRNRVQAATYVARSGAFTRFQPTTPDDPSLDEVQEGPDPEDIPA